MQKAKRLYVSRQAAWEQVCEKKWLSNLPLKVQLVTAGILLPPDNWNPQTGEFQGGVCDAQGNFVAGLYRYQPPKGGFYGISAAYPVVREKLAYVDKEVIFGGVLIGHFGHFILECLGRLWYILKHDTQDKPLVFLTELEVCSWYEHFFALLGISRERIILLQKPAQFKSVIVPEEAVHSWYSYAQEYLLPYRYMVEQAHKLTGHKSLGKKIFLTRNRLADSQTKCVNEEYFCQFFARQGFVMVELETLPLAEQISIVNDAEEIVAIMGSLTHWALFCRPGTKFTMLTRTNNDILDSQCLINEASQVEWYIVDTAMNLFYANRAVGVCLIGPTIFWQEYVQEHYHMQYEDDSWKNTYHEYLQDWTDYMLQPQRWDMLKKVNPLSLLLRINKALHQNELTLPTPEQAGMINFMAGIAGNVYYWDEGLNSLLCLHLDTGEKSVCYRSFIREFPAPLYGSPVNVGRYLVLPPENADAILIYEFATGKVENIPLSESLPRGNFRYAVCYGQWVIMTGVSHGGIIACNPETLEIRSLLNLNVADLIPDDRNPAIVFGKPCLLDDFLYVPVYDTNLVVEVNLEQDGCRIYHVGAEEAAYGFLAAYAGNIWMAPSQGGPMVVWNPQADVMQIFGQYPAGVQFKKIAGQIRFFTDILADDAWLWLIPWGGDRILRLNMENGRIDSVPMELKAQKPLIVCSCIADGKLVLKNGTEIIVQPLAGIF